MDKIQWTRRPPTRGPTILSELRTPKLPSDRQRSQPSRPITLVQPVTVTTLIRILLPLPCRLEHPSLDRKLIEHIRRRYLAEDGPLPR